MIGAAYDGSIDLLWSAGGNFLETLPEPEVVRSIDDTHPAAAQRRNNAVMRDDAPDHGAIRGVCPREDILTPRDEFPSGHGLATSYHRHRLRYRDG